MNDGNDGRDGAPKPADAPAVSGSEARRATKVIHAPHLPEGFSKDLVLGGRDLGNGRMAYAVLDAHMGPVADLHAAHTTDIDGEPVIVTHHAQANAHLFVAAPELYEACKKMLGILMSVGGEGPAIDDLIAVLKKANPNFAPEDVPKPTVVFQPEADLNDKPN